jgi:membrane dipeptidase
MKDELREHALHLHKESIVVDTHCDVLGWLVPMELRPSSPMMTRLFPSVRALGERSELGQVDIPRLVLGGIDCIVFNVGRSPAFESLQRFDVLLSEIDENSEKISTVTSVNEIMSNKSKGKISVILSNEGAGTYEGDLRVLRTMYRLGIRLIGPVWENRNLLADSHNDRTKGRLSKIGESFLREMNRIGVIVDVAHLNDPGFWDVIELSENPVIDSHACCRAISNQSRNLSDEMIEALGEKGGVMGVTFVKRFLSENERDAGVDKIVDHIDHVVNLVGVDHVGIGSDFEGGGFALKDATEMPEITVELVKRGYSDGEVEKILGGNFLRVFEKIWKNECSLFDGSFTEDALR